ncbi:MAG: chemotaxis protein CheB [Alphaproteobacteria bacterium]|nr:chemotaxis protein CheB [Alphaproteobacteria bacterium]
MAKRDIAVVGGSAGSTGPLKTLLGALPADFPGSIFVTTHLSSQHESYLPEMLAQHASLPVGQATDGQAIQAGRVYLAPRDRHLLLIDGALRLGAGPRENMARPAIDPMFRSAALSYGPRVVGVILSGFLNDGASGLYAIKQAGGLAVVQHPADAATGEMPHAALETVDADYVVPAADLAGVLRDLAATDAPPAHPPPDSLAFEVEVANGGRLGSQRLSRFAEPAALTCPDCQGVLSEIRGEHPLRYRCQIGHAYTAADLAARSELLDEAVRIAMRVMEERVELVSRMAREARATGRRTVAELYEARAKEYARYAATLREAALLSMRTAREVAEQPL